MTDHASFVDVHLIGVPTSVWQRASVHQEAIQREFDILKAGLSDDSVPHQLEDLVNEIGVRFGGVGDETWAELYAAAERGEPEVDLVFHVPPGVAGASRELGNMLDKVDEFCRSGETLLTLATPDDLVAFRRWFLGEFSRQIDDGLPPLSWADHFATASRESSDPVSRFAPEGAKSIVYEGELDLLTAGALRDKILSARADHDGDVFVLDMSGVTFIDSVGVSLLVTAHQRLVDDGASLSIVLPERLRLFFEISGLVELLDPTFVASDI